MFQDFVDIATIFSAGATFLTSIVATIALFGARKQLIQLDRNKDAELRPYVSVRYLLEKGQAPSARLQLHNAGRTSARNIVLEFPSEAAWHHIKAPAFSFVNQGLSVLNPGETVEFFMGPVVPGSSFAKLKTDPIRVTVSYED